MKQKINPNGEVFLSDNDRVEIGPTELALNEWRVAGLEMPNLQRMREYRWRRLIEYTVERDYGGILMFDPINIRYATDSTNMQVWNSHNPFRASLLSADGYLVIWEFKKSEFLSEFNPLVKERRTGADIFYIDRGDDINAAAVRFANQVLDLINLHGGGVKRIGVDRITLEAFTALTNIGFEVHPGDEAIQKARSIKSDDEVKAMRCAIHACEQSILAMEHSLCPYKTENDIWSVLHSENIRRGGEWIETRLLTSGPRTNPWFQECGPRVIQENEVVAFDTDLIGCYGMCVDISRSWWVGDEEPRSDMIYAMQHAYLHISENMQMLKPGIHLNDLSLNCHKLDDRFQEQKYGCIMHGVGLADEWPVVCYPDALVDDAYDYYLEPGMIFAMECLISEKGKDFSIKLEEMVLITENGFEKLSNYPLDTRLMGGKPSISSI